MYRNYDSSIMKHIRENLLDGLSSKGVASSGIIDIMKRVPRHFFVSEALRYKAYDDTSLPIGFGQTISKPSIIAKMVESLELTGTERVLEIGTGSGYQSAILAEAAQYVVTIERIKELSIRARNRLFSLKYINIQCIHTHDFNDADGLFNVIIVAAGADLLPTDLFKKLESSGILVIPVKEGNGHEIKKYIKKKDSFFEEVNIGKATFVPFISEECA